MNAAVVTQVLDSKAVQGHLSATFRLQRIIFVSVLLVGLGVGVYFVVRKGKEKRQDTRNQQDGLNEADQEIKILQATTTASYPAYQYTNWANTIKLSVDGCGTNEENINAIFNRLRNNLDFQLLNKAFGIREWTDCPWGKVNGDLSAALTADGADKDYINKILLSKGITYRV